MGYYHDPNNCVNLETTILYQNHQTDITNNENIKFQIILDAVSKITNRFHCLRNKSTTALITCTDIRPRFLFNNMAMPLAKT